MTKPTKLQNAAQLPHILSQIFLCVAIGGKVYLACRSLSRGQLAADDIRSATGVGEDKLLVLEMDLSSLASIRQFAQEFRKSEP